MGSSQWEIKINSFMVVSFLTPSLLIPICECLGMSRSSCSCICCVQYFKINEINTITIGINCLCIMKQVCALVYFNKN